MRRVKLAHKGKEQYRDVQWLRELKTEAGTSLRLDCSRYHVFSRLSLRSDAFEIFSIQ